MIKKKIKRKKRSKKTQIVYDVPALEAKNQRLVIAPASNKDKTLMVWIDGEPAMTFEKVKYMASIGISKLQVANMLGVSRDLFYDGDTSEHCKKLNAMFESGLSDGISRVTESLFNLAVTPGDTKQMAAIAFWLKNRAGWRDVQDVNNKHDVVGTFAEMLRSGAERRALNSEDNNDGGE